MAIQTVLGKIEKQDCGIIMPHEHIFINLTTFYQERSIRDCENPSVAKVTMDKLGILSRDPYALRDNLVMEHFETQKQEILRFKNAGGHTIVDATMPGIGRDIKLLSQISAETGLNIIAGTGFYVSSSHPQTISGRGVNDISKIFIDEIEIGIDGTGIKAGIIGEIGISEIFDDNEKKVLEAAAIASKKTRKSILVHINPWTTLGLEATQILLDCGIAPEKIAISHIDVELRQDYILKLLSMGVYVEFDNFGKEYFVDKAVRRPGYGNFVKDTQRVAFVKNLIDRGYISQILLSCDVCLKTLLCAYGGWGYDHVLSNIVPMMEEIGISRQDINIMLRDNPANFLESEEH